MLEVISIAEKEDKNGKQYKLFLFEFITRKRVTIRAPHTVYGVDYLERTNSLYELDEGDTVEGEIVTMKVLPQIINGNIVTSAALCLFGEIYDPIDREIAIEKLFTKNGFVIEPGQLKYGEQEYAFEKEIFDIPKNCLII